MISLYLKKLLNIESNNEFKKICIFCACFFITIATYTIVREFKDAIFYIIVGKNYIPNAKFLSSILMVFFAIFYSWLSGKVQKHNLLIIYCCIYGIGGIIATYFLSIPIMGLDNEASNFNRIFGWIFYLFFEGYSPFIVGLIWAFFNSVSHPNDVKKNYILATIFSKIGGITSSLLAWLFMSGKLFSGYKFSNVNSFLILGYSTFLLLLIMPILIIYMIKTIPKKEMFGYTEEITNNNIIKNLNLNSNKESFWKTLSTFRSFYVISMFGLIFFWETVNVIFNFMRLNIGFESSTSITGFSAFLYQNIMYTQIMGLLIVLLGTYSFVNIFGERISLMMVPILTGGSVLLCLIFKIPELVLFTYAFMTAMNYSFALPLREALYIPTSKDIQFKTKSWIDGFGAKLSKSFGSIYNKIILYIPLTSIGFFSNSFFIIIILLWVLISYFLGKKWEEAVKNKEIIK